ncbi:hypothetical protein [Nocardia sp. CA-290969]|uniref:hypothetical protein n=1 Tax=Nocardia sp. CA-290969 TaxID=3239986 RepID=UPI003D8B9769
MPTPYLNLEPDELRRMAWENGVRAAKIRKWGEIPSEWLGNFQPSYGAIADPVRSALVDYYRKRHDKAERRAAHHERTRDALLAAADKIEEADRSGGGLVDDAGGAVDDSLSITRPPGAPDPYMPGPGHPQPSAPGHPHNAQVPGAQPVPARDAAPPAPADFVAGVPILPGPAPAVAASASPSYSGFGVPPGPAVTNTAREAPPGSDGRVVTAPSTDRPPLFQPVGGDSATPVERYNEAGAMPAPAGIAATEQPGTGTGLPTIPGLPAPLPPGPFLAAVHAADDRRSRPSFVVGDRQEDDIALARALVASIRAAVADSAADLDWAAAVVRGPIGPVVLLTSTEGRGWLPSGLFLPAEVALPWGFDGVFGPATRRALSALEGTTDPARILAEFCLAVPRRMRIRLTALASSAPISDTLSTAVGDGVAVAASVAAAESAVDLTSPGAGLVDRLELAGSDELRQQAATVPNEQIRATCLGLGRAAVARLREIAPAGDARDDVRARILRALSAGGTVPADWWHELRAVQAVTTARKSPRRDVSHIRIGAVRRAFAEADGPDSVVFERRIDEILRLVAQGPADRRTLRDVLYAYGQVVEHPALAAAAAVTAQPIEVTAARPVAEPPRDTSRGLGPTGAASYSSAQLSSVPAVLPRPSPNP